MNDGRGWRREPTRHALAARGIRTAWRFEQALREMPLPQGEYPMYRQAVDPPNPNFYRVKNVLPYQARSWMGLAFEPDDQYNWAPTQKELIDLAEKYDGTLSGFVIMPQSGRKDARIEFDGVVLKVNRDEARKLNGDLKPSEFYFIKGEGWRFWWD